MFKVHSTEVYSLYSLKVMAKAVELPSLLVEF